MNNFYKWLQNTNAFINKNSDCKHTHLLLNGGKLNISNLDIFYKIYSKCIDNNEYIYLVECRREIYPLFFDLDFLLEEEIDNKLFIEIIKNINDTINLYYDKYYKCIITTADYKKVNKNNINCLKKGFHLHWPNIIVNKDISLKIRQSCIIKLKTIYGNKFLNNFNDIIDESVFNSSGLRLTGSRKGQYIAEEKMFIDEGRPYNILYVLENNEINYEELEILKKNTINLIKQTSIINHNNYNITEIVNTKLQEQEQEQIKETEVNDYTDTSSWNNLSKDSLEYIEILRFFKNYVKDYSIDDIKRVFYTNDVYIIWSKSKYCLNIDRNHKSCGIYFKLNKNGICQKCFCKCDTMEGRKYGYCRDFSSTLVPCTPHLIKLLKFKIVNNDKNNNLVKIQINSQSSFDDFRTQLYNSFTNKTPIRTKKR